MNEFIVWDKILKKFIGKSGKTTDMCTIRNDGLLSLNNDAEMFFYIGLKDINNNKIYADCSIIEFEHLKKQLKGYFWFDKYELRYKIVIDTSLAFGGITKLTTVEYNQDIKNIKIIDTIQEREVRNANTK